jgi:suppressor of fused protein SUFU
MTDRSTREAVAEHHRSPRASRQPHAVQARSASVEVWTWAPQATGEGVWLHATIGASTLMDGLASPPAHRHEFFLGLAAHDGAERSIASLAGYPRDTEDVLDHEHTVSAENQLWSGTEITTLLVLTPLEAIIPPLLLSDSIHVLFLQAIPLHAAERDFKARTSAERLMREFEQRNVPFSDGARPEARLG